MNTQKHTKEQFAALINGRERGEGITNQEEQIAKDSGLLVIFGYSDDNVEVRGVQREEFGCYGGYEFDIGPKGIVWIDEYDVEVLEKYNVLEIVKAGTRKLEAQYGMAEACWLFKTDLPHATFEVKDDDDEDYLFCIGIVIDVEDFHPDAATPFFPQLSPASGDASGSPAVAKCVPVGDPPTLAGVYGSTDIGGVSGEWEHPPFPVQMGATYKEKATGNLVVGLIEVDSRINLIEITGRRMTSQEFGSEFELVSLHGEEVAK